LNLELWGVISMV